KNADWVWERQHKDAFDSIKASLQQAPVLALPDENKSFSVVCDASDYAIGCALPFVIYTDHASLRTATNPPHLSQRMARWLPFFAESNFRVEYKPGKLSVLADALSRRPDYELAHSGHDRSVRSDTLSVSGGRELHATGAVLSTGFRLDQLHRYELAEGLLHYRVDPRDPPRVVVPNAEDMKYDILLEARDAPMSGHLGREKTYQTVSQAFWWPSMYKWVAHYVKTCETYQRVKHSGHASAPLQSLLVPADCWKSMSLDFVFGLPAEGQHRHIGVCLPFEQDVRDKVAEKQAVQLFLDSVFRYHGLPETIVSDRDPRFTGAFWDTLFQLLGTKLTMSVADHPQTYVQTESINRVLEAILHSICAEAPRS
ncbi:LOW QUALITY PROTEIN: Pol protein, partial [Phytophthora palmivora]